MGKRIKRRMLACRYVANKIRRFLTWKGYEARVFSCSEVRTKNYPDYASPPAIYWDPNNAEVV